MKSRKHPVGSRSSNRWVLYLTWVVMAAVPLVFIGFGIHKLVANARAMSWKVVPARVTSCVGSAEKTVDEDTSAESWSVSYEVSYEFDFGGKTWRNRFFRGESVGDRPPDQELVASMARAFLHTLGDGFSANVNPEDPTQAMVQPALGGPVFLLLMGLVAAGVVLHVVKATSKEEPSPPSEEDNG